MQELYTLTAEDIKQTLEPTSRGAVAKTTANLVEILLQDSNFRGVRFNTLTNKPEIHSYQNGEVQIRPVTDADEAEFVMWIEAYYGIYSMERFAQALRILYRKREYNPIIQMVDSLEWDGENRCEHFLAKWAKCEDTPYTREVSRLIFAGGIWRLYRPGCKFDDVAILIGEKQGEGKSTLIKWLAMNDVYFGEQTLFEGQAAIEQMSGKWILEIGELLALTRSKDVEASKAFITRAIDHYRKPYDRNPSELPRHCIFIGTSNNPQPLRDVYNRRYYPVRVHSDGYDLGDHEAECRAYIEQCWAEARDRFRAGTMQNYARRELIPDIRTQQDLARQDDWREGAIEAYLDDKKPGEFVCIRELTNKALGSFGHDPTIVESKDIGMIMSRFDDWVRVGSHRFPEYGKQRSWQKQDAGFKPADEDTFLPF